MSHIRYCWQVLHLANIITHATSFRKVIGTYHGHKTSYLILILGLHKRIRKYRKHYILIEKYIFGNAAHISHDSVGRMLIYSSITNKIQHYTIVFIPLNVLHVSGSSSAHHQELKTLYTALGIFRAYVPTHSP